MNTGTYLLINNHVAQTFYCRSANFFVLFKTIMLNLAHSFLFYYSHPKNGKH